MSDEAIKGLLIGGGTVLGILLGVVGGGVTRRKPGWWRLLASALALLLVVLVFVIPTGGDMPAGKAVAMNRGKGAEFNLYATVLNTPASGTSEVRLRDRYGNEEMGRAARNLDVSGIRAGDDVVFRSRFDRDAARFDLLRVVSVNPIFTLPLEPQLEDQARNLFFHVPAAWLATLAWFVAAWYGFRYVRRRDMLDDLRASSAASVGLIFCILATVTGAFWAQLQWNAAWSWDPRQVSIFAVLVIFGAYFALRSALGDEELRARISSIYLLLLALPVLYFVFVYPRMEKGLHPGAPDLAGGASNAGPLLSAQANTLSLPKQVLYALAMIAFSMIFFWMINLAVRTRVAARELQRRRMLRTAPGSVAAPRLEAIDPELLRHS